MEYKTIPDEMKKLKQWGCFHKVWIPAKKKYNKIPINAYDDSPGKSNDKSTWSDFDTALRALDKYDDADGLAFYFANGYVGLDIDHIREDLEAYHGGDDDPDNLINATQRLTKNSYMEVSLSGAGIHAIFKGKIPGVHRRKGHFEMYESGRFFALTGDTINPYPMVQSLDQKEMKNIYEYFFGKDKVVTLHPENVNFKPVDLPIPEIIKRAENSKTGKRFELFMKGGWEGFYNSQSEADMAFANDLAFWTGKDFNKMDKIFRNSSLMRDKFDAKRGQTTYGNALLNKAINETTEIYSEDNEPLKYDLSFMDNKDSKPKSPKHYGLNDMGNAQRFIDAFGTRVRYSYIDRTWYVYNGSYWENDESGLVEKAADMIPKIMTKEKLVVTNPDDKEKIVKDWHKFISKTSNTNAKKNMLEDVKHHVSIKHGVFDKDNMLLNTPSGYVDLTNGTLYDHDIKKMFAHQTDAEYSDTMQAPHWMQFLSQIFDNDQEKIHFFQKVCGYCATGSTDEQCMFILYGNGRNGKSVALSTFQDIMGNYSSTLDIEALMNSRKNQGSASPEIARLEGSRLVITSEANEDSTFNESLVKQLTGGDRVVARFLYGKDFEFTPKFKIIMATNNLPTIKGIDDGIWRRLVLIPFDVQIPENKVDKHLKDKLKTEYMGILNWIVEGAIAWQSEGLNPPESVRKASQTYRNDNDIVEEFIEDKCDIGINNSVKASDLYKCYSRWCDENGHYAISNTKFGIRMTKKYKKVRKNNGRVYVGLKIHESYPGLTDFM